MLVLFAVLMLPFTSINALENFSCQNVEANKDMAIGQNLPDKAPFTDEIINVYILEEIYGNLQIENKTIKDFSCIKHENATYEIHINNSLVIQDFFESEDIIQTYKEKSDSGEIQIKGIGFGKKVKFFFVKFFLKFA
jgi:hypothetical protein